MFHGQHEACAQVQKMLRRFARSACKYQHLFPQPPAPQRMAAAVAAANKHSTISSSARGSTSICRSHLKGKQRHRKQTASFKLNSMTERLLKQQACFTPFISFLQAHNEHESFMLLKTTCRRLRPTPIPRCKCVEGSSLKGRLTGIELVGGVAVEEPGLVLGAGVARAVAAKECASVVAAPMQQVMHQTCITDTVASMLAPLSGIAEPCTHFKHLGIDSTAADWAYAVLELIASRFVNQNQVYVQRGGTHSSVGVPY